MSSTSRIYRILETELNKALEFTFSIAGNPLRQGAGQVRIPKQFALTVWVRNHATIPMREVRGAITPGQCATFNEQAFRLEQLGPLEHRRVARVEATLHGPHGDASTLDRIAVVSVVAAAVLNEVRFQDAYRALSFAQPTVALPRSSGAEAPTATRCVVDRSRSIPVSSERSGWPGLVPRLRSLTSES